MTRLLVVLLVIFSGAARAQTFATLDVATKGSAVTLSGGNLTASSSVYLNANVYSTISQDAGKHYFEVRFDSGSDLVVGFSRSRSLSSYVGNVANSWSWWSGAGGEYSPPAGELYLAGAHSPYGQGARAGHVVGVAIDIDAGRVWFSRNGVWQGGDPVAGTGPAMTGITGTLWAAFTVRSTSTVNFGAAPFAYSVPSGFNAGWCDGACAGGPPVGGGEALAVAGTGGVLVGLVGVVTLMIFAVVGAMASFSFIEGWRL